MNSLRDAAGRHAGRILALLIIIALYGFARIPEPRPAERLELAAPFSFARMPLPELGGLERRGVRDVHPSLEQISAWISSVGAAVALTDLDGDGLANDVCYVDTRIDRVIVAPTPDRAYRYAPFALEAAPLPYDAATTAPMGCLPGDYDEDGRMDLLAYYWGRTPVLFLAAEGAGAPHATAYRRVELVPSGGRWFTNAATRADLDGDGHADLIIANYFPDGARILDADDTGERQTMQASMSRSYNGGGTHVFLWQSPASGQAVAFEAADLGMGQEVADAWTLAIGAADLDGDLLPELYFANDFGHDRMLHNRSRPGELSFALVEGRRTLLTPRSKVLGQDSFKGMGIDFADVNGDGWLDLYVSNIAQEFALEESHFLFLSTGEPEALARGVAPYRDVSERAGVARTSWSWESRLADLDNDGVLEALQATGFVKGTVNRWPELHEVAMGNDNMLSNPGHWHRVQPGDDLSGSVHNPFFVRNPQGRFVDVAAELDLDEPQVTRGIATADVDGDGDLDFAVANQWDTSRFYLNRSPGAGRSLILSLRLPVDSTSLVGPRVLEPGAEVSSRAAIGAQATLELPDGRRLVAQVDGGNGHSGVRSPELHFGLGDLGDSRALPVRLAWRGSDGQPSTARLELTPGRHTILLGR